jgi:hypothetical protein
MHLMETMSGSCILSRERKSALKFLRLSRNVRRRRTICFSGTFFNSLLTLLRTSTGNCVLPPTDSDGCALFGADREWRSGVGAKKGKKGKGGKKGKEGKKGNEGCFPTSEKLCLLSPYHVWYEERCNHNPTEEVRVII